MNSYKYSVVRYRRNPIRNEPINIGIVLHSASERVLAYQFDDRHCMTSPDKQVLRRYDEQLQKIATREVCWQDASFQSISVCDPDFLEQLSDRIGSQITFEPPRGCRANNHQELLRNLIDLFVTEHQHSVAS
jgi:hypothetical protein